MPEGETDVNATVEFLPLRPALDVKTRTAGDAIKDINNLCVLLYDKEGNLMKLYYLLPEGSSSTEKNDGSFKVKDEDRTNADAEGGRPTAESRTQQASFQLSGVPYGNHYIYAVANMGNLEDTHYPAIKTREGLKSIGLEWKAENWVATEETGDGAKSKAIANNQMFGHFTTLPDAPTGANRNTEDALVTINKKGMTLHAWIRRAASKVTVAYDASKLKEGVFIYLKSVQIKDIPTHCYLGKDNKVGDEKEYDLPFPANGEEMPDGEVIKYYEGDAEPTVFDASYPVRLSTGKSYYPWPVEENGVLQKKGHEETADALFFFENMQGIGPSKLQDADGDKELDHPGLQGDDFKYPYYRPKDDMPYGTYIEVDAYYVSVNPERVGSGNIKYRFMLGKDVTTDYNAERNHHYKLTLKFKNFANDADWHIEYEEPEPGIEVPNPYYISYLYNHSMMLPLKIKTGGEGRKLTQIDAVILDNRWAPNNPNEDYKYWSKMDIPYQNQWNGFLSLRKTKHTVIVKEEVGDNQSYYEDHNRGNRTYDITQGDGTFGSDEEGDGVYTVKNEGDGIYHVSIPMYTRAKQLIKETGYTGNNPYVAYQRRAEVRIVATLDDGTKISTDGKDLNGNKIPSQNMND
ncbi:MAG: DUF4906 domain-containing protein, partial [Bacteroides sp.]|nr:DUF4906 domain-containing protein [Bacteroides sp.]